MKAALKTPFLVLLKVGMASLFLHVSVAVEYYPELKLRHVDVEDYEMSQETLHLHRIMPQLQLHLPATLDRNWKHIAAGVKSPSDVVDEITVEALQNLENELNIFSHMDDRKKRIQTYETATSSTSTRERKSVAMEMNHLSTKRILRAKILKFGTTDTEMDMFQVLLDILNVDFQVERRMPFTIGRLQNAAQDASFLTARSLRVMACDAILEQVSQHNLKLHAKTQKWIKHTIQNMYFHASERLYLVNRPAYFQLWLPQTLEYLHTVLPDEALHAAVQALAKEKHSTSTCSRFLPMIQAIDDSDAWTYYLEYLSYHLKNENDEVEEIQVKENGAHSTFPYFVSLVDFVQAFYELEKPLASHSPESAFVFAYRVRSNVGVYSVSKILKENIQITYLFRVCDRTAIETRRMQLVEQQTLSFYQNQLSTRRDIFHPIDNVDTYIQFVMKRMDKKSQYVVVRACYNDIQDPNRMSSFTVHEEGIVLGDEILLRGAATVLERPILSIALSHSPTQPLSFTLSWPFMIEDTENEFFLPESTTPLCLFQQEGHHYHPMLCRNQLK